MKPRFPCQILSSRSRIWSRRLASRNSSMVLYRNLSTVGWFLPPRLPLGLESFFWAWFSSFSGHFSTASVSCLYSCWIASLKVLSRKPLGLRASNRLSTSSLELKNDHLTIGLVLYTSHRFWSSEAFIWYALNMFKTFRWKFSLFFTVVLASEWPLTKGLSAVVSSPFSRRFSSPSLCFSLTLSSSVACRENSHNNHFM